MWGFLLLSLLLKGGKIGVGLIIIIIIPLVEGGKIDVGLIINIHILYL